MLFQSDLEKIVGARPFAQLTSYQEYISGETEKKRDAQKAEKKASEEIKNAPLKVEDLESVSEEKVENISNEEVKTEGSAES